MLPGHLLDELVERAHLGRGRGRRPGQQVGLEVARQQEVGDRGCVAGGTHRVHRGGESAQNAFVGAAQRAPAQKAPTRIAHCTAHRMWCMCWPVADGGVCGRPTAGGGARAMAGGAGRARRCRRGLGAGGAPTNGSTAATAQYTASRSPTSSRTVSTPYLARNQRDSTQVGQTVLFHLFESDHGLGSAPDVKSSTYCRNLRSCHSPAALPPGQEDEMCATKEMRCARPKRWPRAVEWAGLTVSLSLVRDQRDDTHGRVGKGCIISLVRDARTVLNRAAGRGQLAGWGWLASWVEGRTHAAVSTTQKKAAPIWCVAAAAAPKEMRR